MLRHFSAPTPRFGRAKNRLHIGHQERSPYYWWWQYLRRNADYLACCERGGKGKLAKLYKDFGDVRNDDFQKWWTTEDKGVHLFAEQPLAVRFGELDRPEEWQANWDKDIVMVVVVPMSVSKRQLKGSFAKLLDRRHKGNKSGRPSLAKLKEVSTARYQLERNYTISGLALALAVYDLWEENQKLPLSNRLKLWEIGKQCGINKAAIKDAVSSSSADRLVGRNVLAATVSRYLKQTREMIRNVGIGRFPLGK